MNVRSLPLFGIFYVWMVSSLLWTTTQTSSKLEKICEQPDKAKCEMNLNVERVICSSNLLHYKNYKNAKIVYMCSWLDSFMNPEEILSDFPLVKKLAITQGNITEFLTDFPRSVHLQHLILTDLNIGQLKSTLFFSLEKLEFLDLSRNNLKRLSEEAIKNPPSLSKIILTENPWDCTSDFFWILNKTLNSKIPHKDRLLCGGIFSGKPLYSVVSFTKKMKKDCPQDICSCVMNNIVWNTQKSNLIPVITVNCSDKGITELPAKLPVNTTTLLLSGNNISNLLPLIHNEMYGGIADIYLDRNHVKSIDVLEGALWLKTFRVLSLRENYLTQLPIYALDNAFEKNTNMAKLYLGQNPWKCDCSFTPDFQNFLIKYRGIVKDKNDVTCSVQQNDDNSNLQVTTLSTNSLCRKADRAINPLDILSAVLASLILLIICKLLFDWWVYKRTGSLPWIAAKMPW